MQNQTFQGRKLTHQTQAIPSHDGHVSPAIMSPLSAEQDVPLSQQQEMLFSSIIAQYFSQDDSAWSIHVTKQWVIVSAEPVKLPSQGWKLHVSAGLYSATQILHSVLPILRAAHVCFKVAASFAVLRSLNHGFMGASQVGKFITVYPADEAQAVELALALDETTRGLRGPAIPSDRPLHPASLIFYRYGSFVRKLTYTPTGKVVSAITTPEGDLVPDSRQKVYEEHDWVQDPFVAAGVARHQNKQPSLLIGARYLLLASLYESPRGGVSLGVDVQQADFSVLKYAERNAYLDTTGQDACDDLRREANILQHLAGDPLFPAVYDLIEQGDTLYLVMEKVEGETLGRYAERLFMEGNVPIAQVVSWGRELAHILGKMHDRGLVYRDLKPTNIIVSDEGRLRLIDFELALYQGERHPRGDIGTRGFTSPQHQAGQPAQIADDIYSLGALLYYLVSRADPSHAPDPSDLLQRPLLLLTPGLNAGIVEIITRCLSPQTGHRFISMKAVDAALASLSEQMLSDPVLSLGEETLSETREDAGRRYLALARRLGDTLCKTAIHQTERPGVTWLSTVQSNSGMPLRAIHTGSSGTILALAELVAAINDATHRSTLEEGVRWLLHSDSLIARPMPGLYVGEAGVGAALLRAGQVLGEQALIAAAVEKSLWVAQQPYNCQDLMRGAAGRLRFHLLLWDETHDHEHLQAALDAGNWLLTVVEDAGDGMSCWTLPPEFTGQSYVGYAHGAAGIADTLVDLFEATGDERFLKPVTGVYRLLEHLAVPIFHDGSGVNWPLYVSDKRREMAGIHWCHGAVGIGIFLQHIRKLDLVPYVDDLIRRAVWAVARGSRWTNPTQCHGLAGSIEFLLDIFQETNQQAYYVETQSLARLLESFGTEQESLLVWPSDEPSCVSPDYLVGYAGVLVCLLRLSNPERCPRQLSRPGFRHTLSPGRYAHPHEL